MTAAATTPATHRCDGLVQVIDDLLVRLLTLEAEELSGDVPASLRAVPDPRQPHEERDEVAAAISSALVHLGASDLPGARMALIHARHLARGPATGHRSRHA